MKFTVVITKYGREKHARCFEDVARAMVASLRQLGHTVTDERDPGRLIMFGAGNLTDAAGVMPPDAIFFNAEQMTAVRDPHYFMEAADLYRGTGRTVWDYSEENVERLRKIGCRVVHCPIGYHPSMTRIERAPAGSEDVDVLFYGAVNDRRRQILDALDAAGLRVVRAFGVYGSDLDALIARSKVVVNVHYYEYAVFEIFRVSHLLANRKCVVTEDDGKDAELEALAGRTTVRVPYDRIVEECARLVKDAAARRRAEDAGFESFSETSFPAAIERAIRATEALS